MEGHKVVELFAGVGGFHLAAKKSGWDVKWANEWFPDTHIQHAYNCYEKHFQADFMLYNDFNHNNFV